MGTLVPWKKEAEYQQGLNLVNFGILSYNDIPGLKLFVWRKRKPNQSDPNRITNPDFVNLIRDRIKSLTNVEAEIVTHTPRVAKRSKTSDEWKLVVSVDAYKDQNGVASQKYSLRIGDKMLGHGSTPLG